MARSLKVRNDTPPALAGLFWLRHVIDVETALSDRDHYIVEYDRVIGDAANVARHLFSHFGLPAPGPELEDEASAFIREDLRHHAVEDWSDAPAFQLWLHRVYEKIRLRAPEPPTEAAMQAVREVGEAVTNSADALHALRVFATDRIGRLEDELRAVRDRRGALEADLSGQREEVARLQSLLEDTVEEATRYQAKQERDLAKALDYQAKQERDLAEALNYQAKRERDLAETMDYQAKLEKDVQSLARDTKSARRELAQSQKSAAALEKTVGEAVAVARHVQDRLRAHVPDADAQLARMASEDGLPLQQALRQVEVFSDEVLAHMGAVSENSQRRAERIEELETRLAFETAHAEYCAQKLDEIGQSTFWRMTAPLRRLVNLWRNKTRLGFRLLAGQQVRDLMRSDDLGASLDASRSASVRAARLDLQASRPGVLEAGWMRARHAPLLPDADLPNVTISAVTYNSEGWLDGFIRSLEALDYPKDRLSVHFVDNGSSDSTVDRLERWAAEAGARFRDVAVSRRPNLGYGAGNDWAIRASSDPFVLVTNVDAEFYADSLGSCVRFALSDDADVACWEFRQTPYEHPKYYDPVTLETNWNAHACVLIRQDAYLAVGGYDKKIFMYGEDVELSYRFRAQGHRLRYVPYATILHHVDLEDASKRPNQLSGSTAANVLMRYRYGTYRDIAAGEALLQAVRKNETDPVRIRAFETAGRIVSESRGHFWRNRPSKRSLRKSGAAFPFNEFDYDVARLGNDVVRPPFRASRRPDLPLVSIVTRTHGPSDVHLRNVMACVLNQTYPNIEHIIVEDKTDDGREIVERAAETFGRDRIRYFKSPGKGRSECGNFGASQARGEWICWLDNDDLLFADHVETLVRALDDDPDAVASYAFAWDAHADMVDGEPVLHRFEFPDVHNRAYDKARLMVENFIPIQAILFRRDLFERFGGFNPDFSQLEDWNLWVRYSQVGNFVHTPKITSLYLTPSDAAARETRHLRLHEAYETVNAANSRDAATTALAARGGRASQTTADRLNGVAPSSVPTSQASTPPSGAAKATAAS
ncbi:MAG: glycosyltransferase [Pseudomonadota bacterium]